MKIKRLLFEKITLFFKLCTFVALAALQIFGILASDCWGRYLAHVYRFNQISYIFKQNNFSCDNMIEKAVVQWLITLLFLISVAELQHFMINLMLIKLFY